MPAIASLISLLLKPLQRLYNLMVNLCQTPPVNSSSTGPVAVVLQTDGELKSSLAVSAMTNYF